MWYWVASGTHHMAALLGSAINEINRLLLPIEMISAARDLNSPPVIISLPRQNHGVGVYITRNMQKHARFWAVALPCVMYMGSFMKHFIANWRQFSKKLMLVCLLVCCSGCLFVILLLGLPFGACPPCPPLICIDLCMSLCKFVVRYSFAHSSVKFGFLLNWKFVVIAKSGDACFVF